MARVKVVAEAIRVADIKRAWGNFARSGVRCCQLVYQWAESEPTNQKGEPITNYASYLAPALEVTPARVNQLYSAGKAFQLGLSGVTDRKMIEGLTEAHLRPLATLVSKPEMLQTVVEDLIEQTDEGETPSTMLVRQCVDHAKGKAVPVLPGSDEVSDRDRALMTITRAFQKLATLLDKASVDRTVGNKLGGAHAAYVKWKADRKA